MDAMAVKAVEVGRASELSPGQMKRVVVSGREILIARVGDRYYAADNRCPHMGGNLSQGTLDGTVVTCPRHGSQFDLSNGNIIRWTTWPSVLVAADQIRSRKRSLRIYPVTVQEDKIRLTL